MIQYLLYKIKKKQKVTGNDFRGIPKRLTDLPEYLEQTS